MSCNALQSDNGDATSNPSTVAPVDGQVRSLDALFIAAQAGDRDAWGEMVERLAPAVWAVSASFRLNRSEREDLAQTVWLRLLDKHHTIREPAAVAGWVKQTAHNAAADMMRRQDRDPDSYDELANEPTGNSPGPDAVAEADEEQELLVAGLVELEATDPRCAQLLRLLAHKVAYADISEMLDIAVGSIGMTRSRCLDKVRQTAPIKRLREARS